MFRKILRNLKTHWIKLASSLLIGVLIGGGVIYSIEQKQEEFWREKYMTQKRSNDSLRTRLEKLHERNSLLHNTNRELKDDLGIAILSSIRSNFYNLRALKSEDYNTQMYYNQEEYKSNLVPKKIGEKWDINVFSPGYKQKLNTMMDSILSKETE